MESNVDTSMQYNDRHIEDLLPLFCEGRLTPEDAAVVEKWLDENEQHKEILAKMLSLCVDMDALEVVSRIDTEKALKRVTSKIRSAKWRQWGAGLQKFAAMLTVPLIAAVTWLALGEQPDKTEETEVGMLEFHTTAGMTGKVMLPDGSTAILNSGSVLRYPSTFAGADSRSVSFEGEAFFDIAGDEKRPFVITTASNEKIKVYGTEFNLEAYADENCIATLVDGSIGFIYSDNTGKEHEVMLTPNHKLEFNPSCKMLSIKETSCLAETAWKDGKIILDKTPLRDIVKTLSKRYNVDFSIKDEKLAAITFSGGAMTINSLEHTLESLKIASGIQWRIIPVENLDSRQIIEIY